MKSLFRKENVIRLATIILVLVFSSQAFAHEIACGAKLDPDRKYVMENDLECDKSPVLTLQTNTHLNLNNHTIKAVKDVFVRICVLMEGEKASVINGFLEECDQGVVLAGSGKHSVKRVKYSHSKPGTHQGFLIKEGSDNNVLFYNTATAADGCFEVYGNYNRLIGNTSFDSPGIGFWIGPSANYNRLFYNTAINHEPGGFLVQGDNNKFFINESLDNGLIDASFTGSGFEVSGSGNKFFRNTALDNTGDGFKVFSENNMLYRNIANYNEEFGISISGTNNRIVRNQAFDNGETDLHDANLECDNNKWRNNKFNTRSADCIR